MTDRLLELLRTRSFARRPVVLASGKHSDFFIDCKQTVLLAEGHALVGEAMFRAASQLSLWPKAVAGVELGGCSLASSVALISQQRGQPIDAMYVRKALKDHGAPKWVEGDSHLRDHDPVVVVEDVITTGGSTLRAVQKLRERPLNVVGVIALVDRMEGGASALAEAGVPLIALYRRTDFIPAE
jgi:orotate phosphoribosyltransferase